MHPAEIRRHVRQQPFLPVRVFVSDGSTYDVHDPEYVYIDRREVAIGLEIGEGGVPQRTAYIDPVHITRIEPLPRSNGARSE
jgi:hypothetical protein